MRLLGCPEAASATSWMVHFLLQRRTEGVLVESGFVQAQSCKTHFNSQADHLLLNFPAGGASMERNPSASACPTPTLTQGSTTAAARTRGALRENMCRCVAATAWEP